MARLILCLMASLLTMAAIADDENKGRGNEKKALVADCERQANQQNLIGKERKKYVKDCTKEGKHGKRRAEGRDKMGAPAAAQTTQPVQAGQPTQPTAQPATAATPPAAASAPAQPAPTEATQPAASPTVQPAATAVAKRTAPGSAQRRAECEASPEYKKAPVFRRRQVLANCMSAS